jgi:hypothetical protein
MAISHAVLAHSIVKGHCAYEAARNVAYTATSRILETSEVIFVFRLPILFSIKAVYGTPAPAGLDDAVRHGRMDRYR